jgi:hypothetical protein
MTDSMHSSNGESNRRNRHDGQSPSQSVANTPVTSCDQASPTASLARTLLDLAASIENEEQRIKREILEAAKSGHLDRVCGIVQRWLSVPVDEVLRQAPNDRAGLSERRKPRR